MIKEMETFSVKERFEDSINQIWNNKDYDNIPIKRFGYAAQDNIVKNALMFIGINASNSDENEDSFFYTNSQEYKQGGTHRYFEKFCEISKEVNFPWTHTDLLFVRFTNQKEVEETIYKYENGVKFFYEQLLISKQIIEEAKPKVIVVNNTFARRLLGYNKDTKDGKIVEEWMGFDFEFDDEIGTRKIIKHNTLNGTPVFFTSMLTGQRALDKGSYERLIWHIKYVSKK